MLPSERRLTRHVESGPCFNTHATCASRVRRSTSMSPSTSSNVTSWRSRSLLRHLRPHELLLRRRAPRAAALRRAAAGRRNGVPRTACARQFGDREVEARELTRELEHRGRGRLVLEAAGVAHERGVETDRGVAGHRELEAGDQAPHEHAARGRVGVDHVDGAVALVRDVVVDHHELLGGLGRRFEIAEAGQRTGVEGDHHARLAREPVGRREQLEPGQLAVVRRDDERLGERRDARDPGRDAARGASASIEPSASPSGLTWHARLTSGALLMTRAASVNASSTGRSPLTSPPRRSRHHSRRSTPPGGGSRAACPRCVDRKRCRGRPRTRAAAPGGCASGARPRRAGASRRPAARLQRPRESSPRESTAVAVRVE